MEEQNLFSLGDYVVVEEATRARLQLTTSWGVCHKTAQDIFLPSYQDYLKHNGVLDKSTPTVTFQDFNHACSRCFTYAYGELCQKSSTLTLPEDITTIYMKITEEIKDRFDTHFLTEDPVKYQQALNKNIQDMESAFKALECGTVNLEQEYQKIRQAFQDLSEIPSSIGSLVKKILNIAKEMQAQAQRLNVVHILSDANSKLIQIATEVDLAADWDAGNIGLWGLDTAFFSLLECCMSYPDLTTDSNIAINHEDGSYKVILEYLEQMYQSCVNMKNNPTNIDITKQERKRIGECLDKIVLMPGWGECVQKAKTVDWLGKPYKFNKFADLDNFDWAESYKQFYKK